MAQTVKSPRAMQKTRVQSLGWEETLEKEVTTHSSILDWEISWTEEPGGLQSMRSERVRDYCARMRTHKCSIDSKFYWDKLWSDLYGRFW